MSVKALTSDEAKLIAAYPTKKIKRYQPGDSSNWDNRPFRERVGVMFRKAATTRRKPK